MTIKRVLVTGSGGFLGKNLCRQLEAIGVELVMNSKTGNHYPDITNYGELLSIKDEIEAIVHLAAKTSISNSLTNPHETYFTNVIGTLNILEFARKKQVRNFIYISTYVYGQPKYLPIDESHPVDPHQPYNLSKYLGEQLCRSYSRDFGLNIVVLRPFYIYGPYCKSNRLIPSIIHQIDKHNGRVTLSGENTRIDFLFVKDFVDLITEILVNFPHGYDIYNVGTGKSNTLEEVAEIIATLLGRKIIIDYGNEKRINDVGDMVADISKINRTFDWRPKTSLHDGLQLTLKQDLPQRF